MKQFKINHHFTTVIYVSHFYVSLLNHEPYFYTSFLIQEPFSFRLVTISFPKWIDINQTCHDLDLIFRRSSRSLAISSSETIRHKRNLSRFAQAWRLSIRENGWAMGSECFRDALESRRSLAVNVERQIPAARSKDGRGFEQKVAGKLSTVNVDAKPFHLPDYGISIFSARDPVAFHAREEKWRKNKRRGELRVNAIAIWIRE